MPGRTANVRYWAEIELNADIGFRVAFGPKADRGIGASKIYALLADFAHGEHNQQTVLRLGSVYDF
jgi:hypothetical protein